MSDRPEVPDEARIHVLWNEVGQQSERLRRHEDSTHARFKVANARIDVNAERIEDLRLWRAKMIGAILAGGLGGGTIGAAIVRMLGGG